MCIFNYKYLGVVIDQKLIWNDHVCYTRIKFYGLGIVIYYIERLLQNIV